MSVWTHFDLVRPRLGAWGSSGHTSFIKFDSGSIHQNVSVGAKFGSSVANIGDLNGDGIDDLAVGASGESGLNLNGTVVSLSGGLYVLFLSKNGSVSSSVHINALSNGGPSLNSGDQFGYSVAGAGDLDGDSVPDILVGAPGFILSCAYILFMQSDGVVKSIRLIRGQIQDANPLPPSEVNGPPIQYGSR